MIVLYIPEPYWWRTAHFALPTVYIILNITKDYRICESSQIYILWICSNFKESCKNFDIILLLKLCMSCLLKLKSRTDRQTNIALFWDCIAPKKFKMGQGKKTKCFETLAQSSFANTFPLGLVGEILETKTKIRPKMLQKWDFSCSPFFF